MRSGDRGNHRQERLAHDGFLSATETWALIGCQPLAQLSNQALLPSLGSLRIDLDLSYVELGWVVAAFGLARLLVDLPAGGLASRWNPRGLLILAFGASAFGSALGVFAANGWQLAGVRLLIGISSSVAQAMILAWLVGGAGRVARGRVMARSEAFFGATGLVIPAIGGLLAGASGWRGAFVLGAVAALVGLLAILALTRATSAARSVGLAEGASVAFPASRMFTSGWLELRQAGRVLLALYLVTFVVFFCRNGMLNAVLPVLGSDRLGFQPFQIGVLFSTINAVSIGAVLLGGRMGDRFGRYRLLVPGLALLFGTQLLLLAVQDQVSYVVVGLLQGLAFFVNPLPVGLLGDALPTRLRARGIAIYRAVSDVALLSAPALLGVALQLGGFMSAELVSISMTFIVLVLVWAIRG